MSDLRAIGVRRAIRFVASNLVVSSMSSLLGLILVRTLGPAEAGRFAVVSQFVYVGVPIVSLGLLEAFAVLGPSMDAAAREASLARLRVLFLLLFGSAAAGLALLSWRGFLFPELSAALLPTGALLVLGGVSSLEGARTRGDGAFGQLTVLVFVRDVGGRALAIALLVGLGTSDFRVAVWCLVAGAALGTAMLRPRGKVLLDFTTPLPRALRKLAARNYFGLTVYLAVQSVDIAALRILKDPSLVGVYSAGVKLPALVYSIVVSQLAIPLTYFFASPQWHERRHELVSKGSAVFTFGTGVCAACLAGFAAPISRAVYGAEFDGAVVPMQLYAFTMVASSSSFFGQTLLNATGLPHHLVPFSLLQLAASATLAVVLVPREGAIGAAGSLLLATWLQAVCLVWWVERRYGVRFFRRLLAHLGTASAALYVGRTAAAPLAPAVYAAGAILLGAIRVDELSWAWGAVRRSVRHAK
jgi:O-antigen/teichoic acid export membrane protein